MADTIDIGDISIAVTRRDVKNVHLSVHPPDGRVTLVAPRATRLDVARAYAVTRLGWIRKQQAQLRGQARETPRRFVGRETHYLWGRRHLLHVIERDQKPVIEVTHRSLRLIVRPGTTEGKRAEIMHKWHLATLHTEIPEVIRRWEKRLGVKVAGYFLQRMKTKWGSCNPAKRTIRLNTELVKKPKDLIEYVIVHEMLHILEARHSEKFIALLDRHVPSWREARDELNSLPVPDL